MKLTIERSKLVKPSYQGKPPRTDVSIPLSPFDKATFDAHISIIYAFPPPTPSNDDIEKGLAAVLSEYRESAGRLHWDDTSGEKVILLNDAGVRFVEASSDLALDRAILVKQSKDLLSLHPDTEGVEEVVLVQLTRFACGILVVGFSAHHVLVDGNAVSNFLVAWGRATRGLPVEPLPLHDRSTFFAPRSPLRVEFEHRGAEFMPKKAAITSKDDALVKQEIVFHKSHFTREFLAKLKTTASANATLRTYSTFQILVAHLWRVVTKVRGLDGISTTHVRISVNGRARMKPRVPDEYFGNLVLWAFPQARARELVNSPLHHAAALIQDAVARLDDGYFRSFIDFSSSAAVDGEGLVPSTTALVGDWVMSCPNLEVQSWLKFPFQDVDFGGGTPSHFVPSYCAVEGLVILSPSFFRDGSIDAYVSLFSHDVSSFKQLCYRLD